MRGVGQQPDALLPDLWGEQSGGKTHQKPGYFLVLDVTSPICQANRLPCQQSFTLTDSQILKTMSSTILGFDLGTSSAVIAVAQKGGVDIILNEVSNRATPYENSADCPGTLLHLERRNVLLVNLPSQM